VTATTERQAFPATPASAGAARRFVESVLDGPDQRALQYPATLLVSELVANAVLHTGTPIEVVIHTGDQGDAVRIEVHDGNPQLPVRKHYSTMSGTGRGLLLVERMASSWGAERTAGGKVVWFELDGSATPALDFLEAEAL
jgi:anti-sigma regulatory factor (Ser/Thr protein kinase)